MYKAVVCCLTAVFLVSCTPNNVTKAAPEAGGQAGAARRANKLTVSDYADILIKIEARQGYEAARRYVTNNLDYAEITAKAKSFADGKDNNKNNDPNIMPTRFMLLYGADDSRLREINSHPDRFEGTDHRINVENLRKGLKLSGYDAGTDGPFDDTLLSAFMEYLKNFQPVDFYRIDEHDNRGNLMLKYGMPSWKYFDENDDHKSIMKELSPKYGDELVTKAGGDTRFDKFMFCYRYPWVAFRLALNKEKRGDGVYEIFNSLNNELIEKNLIRRNPPAVETLLPDVEDITVFIDGVEIRMDCDSCD